MKGYRVIQWDNPRRWLVLKITSPRFDGYLVELDRKGNQCGCRHGETHPENATCKHIAMAQKAARELVGKS